MSAIVVESQPGQLTNYMYEVKEGDLQDIEAEESNNMDNIYIHFESQKFKPNKNVEVTSFLADSDTAVTMDVEEAVRDVKNRSSGADMISAFFVAPEDEVHENHIRINKKKAEDRGDRRELYTAEGNTDDPNQYDGENTTPLPQVQNSLTNDILAPLRAAVSLSHDSQNQPMIEKQMIKEMPVYKTYIEIQKSIPIELKEETPKEEENKQPYTTSGNDILQQLMLAYHLPQYRTPQYYQYPSMYYLPQDYIGNYIMQHSHENTGVIPYLYRPRPLYYYIKYQPQAPSYPPLYSPYPEEHIGDQNTLQTEQQQVRTAPIRPSQPVFSSVYPPHTYRVAAVMTPEGRGIHARSVRSKQLCIEYGGFKPPMVPSVQIDEAGRPQQQKSVVEEKADS
ncbi:uncharacterized protein [Halyomorpha halys]|uniref:uncharacterized protein n=1 Tax=Halyomorpha halys TaxID=286706 RepID=UPI0006D51427